MRLENFAIHSSIELKSGNLLWDLHNVADFRGLELLPTETLLSCAGMGALGRSILTKRSLRE
jgi:hypothetical protein